MLFSIDGPGHQPLAGLGVEPCTELVPEGLVAPVFHALFGRHLHVVAAARGAAHAAQRKAALGVGVDEFVRHRRHVGQHAQPAEGVDLLVGLDGVGRHARAAHAVVAVAAGDEVAFELVRLPVLLVAHARPGRVEVVQAHVRRAVDGGEPFGRARFHQVARHLGLAVHRHLLAAREAVHVDAVARALEEQLDALVRQALGLGAGVDAGTRQQVHGDLFEHAGADAPQHVVAALAFDDDVVDASLVQKLPEQKAGGAGADDRDLGAHVRVSERFRAA
jgi:hypothetical protein